MISVNVNQNNPVIGWWSGGITSAVACKIACNLFGPENCRFILLDTQNEADDTYRFKGDCEQWYGAEIEMIRNPEYDSIEQVWEKYQSMNVAHGAICSSELKRKVRKRFQKNNPYSYQVFGFGSSKREVNRARAMKLNYPESNPIFPLLMYGLEKKDCIEIVLDSGIEPPITYKYGFENNNCWKTGCVQGGIGYWQKMRRVQPEKFDRMADMEHKLTDTKGKPVTMLKDQSKGGGLLFLKPHPDYPEVPDISKKEGREPKMLIECNGFCGLDDLQESNYETNELNLQAELDLTPSTKQN